MGFIEYLNKFGHKVSIHKTDIYSKIEEAKLPLEKMGLKVKIKNEFDLFDYEIIYKGMLTQNYIENAYEIFLSQHYDLLDYLNYEEKRNMFNNDIQDYLSKAPCFKDEISDTLIYIPYLEPFVNQRYQNDYQLLLLKQHRDYINQYKINKDQPIILYSKDVYRSNFSSLQNVYEDDRHLCYYYDALKTIYIFKKEDLSLLNKVIILDHDSNQELECDDVKYIAECIESYQYKPCLDFMLEKGYIGEKTYKKVLKKYQ